MHSSNRKQLNHHQLDILRLLARFRFGTTALFTQSTGTTSRRYIHERLRILTEQEYIGKRYDSSYKLLGKPAAYHLLPKGIDALKTDNVYDTKLLKLLAKDSNASDRFIRHCLSVLAASVQLSGLYGTEHTQLQFRTRSDYAGNELFPQALPDGYAFTENAKTKERTHYFVECFDGTMPDSVMRKTITKHVDWYDNDNWTTEALYPTVLLLCRDERLKAKVDKWVTKILDDAWSDDVQFKTLLPK
ncbi:hypothetical protein A2707_04985 [Candidatus Saccharibacteria bacterium RIFCSPHIGHO2_01_FULL_45_15]|nr:MAG: hypothetical protein A2707_04985 [Candidatus Saccharibacteria bacterium RIFCSPHIGHO2_01_FULL_45_15]OGL28607.1 MAG: hypothetical protein A3C39_04755 [Candidatus Saccharibacteria bacterium RIFCSPHIGHO2_02_FULL_46_12]OGL32676.1 MAG: hypothetical protein A3E76_04980 [Candidatus Saccharibacteria bacterium RIFCSPHIGHO2_12_FULL_44_22]